MKYRFLWYLEILYFILEILLSSSNTLVSQEWYTFSKDCIYYNTFYKNGLQSYSVENQYLSWLIRYLFLEILANFIGSHPFLWIILAMSFKLCLIYLRILLNRMKVNAMQRTIQIKITPLIYYCIIFEWLKWRDIIYQ